jgi:hypothetical protein
MPNFCFAIATYTLIPKNWYSTGNHIIYYTIQKAFNSMGLETLILALTFDQSLSDILPFFSRFSLNMKLNK